MGRSGSGRGSTVVVPSGPSTTRQTLSGVRGLNRPSRRSRAIASLARTHSKRSSSSTGARPLVLPCEATVARRRLGRLGGSGEDLVEDRAAVDRAKSLAQAGVDLFATGAAQRQVRGHHPDTLGRIGRRGGGREGIGERPQALVPSLGAPGGRRRGGVRKVIGERLEALVHALAAQAERGRAPEQLVGPLGEVVIHAFGKLYGQVRTAAR